MININESCFLIDNGRKMLLVEYKRIKINITSQRNT